MMRQSIVILSSHALVAQGIASRLRQYLQQADLEVIDPRQPDAMSRMMAARPSAVIMDSTDTEATQRCPLSGLLLLLPALKVIRLDPQRQQIQVVTSEQRPAVEVRDLAAVIGQCVPAY